MPGGWGQLPRLEGMSASPGAPRTTSVPLGILGLVSVLAVVAATAFGGGSSGDDDRARRQPVR